MLLNLGTSSDKPTHNKCIYSVSPPVILNKIECSMITSGNYTPETPDLSSMV